MCGARGHRADVVDAKLALRLGERNASAMLPLLAKNGARSIAAVRRSENGDTATTAAMRRIAGRRLQRDRGAHRRAHHDDRPRRDAVEHAARSCFS